MNLRGMLKHNVIKQHFQAKYERYNPTIYKQKN